MVGGRVCRGKTAVKLSTPATAINFMSASIKKQRIGKLWIILVCLYLVFIWAK